MRSRRPGSEQGRAATPGGKSTKRYGRPQRVGRFVVRHYGPKSDKILRATLVASWSPQQLLAHEISYHIDEAPIVEAWLATGAADRDFIEADPPCPVPLYWGDDPNYQWTDLADWHHGMCERARQPAISARALPRHVIAEREYWRALEQQQILEQLANLFAYASTGPMGAA